jgi:hypothetical protein
MGLLDGCRLSPLFAGQATCPSFSTKGQVFRLGHLMGCLDDLALWDDTAGIFFSDHGFYLGEHGLVGETGKLRNFYTDHAPVGEEIQRVAVKHE